MLDEHLAPTPPARSATSTSGASGLSPGYWRDADKTRGRVRADPRPPGGERIYRTGDLARGDDDGWSTSSAASTRRSRAAATASSSARSRAPSTPSRACASARSWAWTPDGFEGTAICAAYVAGGGLEPPASRARWPPSLPGYMLPARWMGLDALPKNQNGKIDRPELRKRFTAEAEKG